RPALQEPDAAYGSVALARAAPRKLSHDPVKSQARHDLPAGSTTTPPSRAQPVIAHCVGDSGPSRLDMVRSGSDRGPLVRHEVVAQGFHPLRADAFDNAQIFGSHRMELADRARVHWRGQLFSANAPSKARTP